MYFCMMSLCAVCCWCCCLLVLGVRVDGCCLLQDVSVFWGLLRVLLFVAVVCCRLMMLALLLFVGACCRFGMVRRCVLLLCV